MTDLLQNGAQWLRGMIKTYASQTVTYHRDVESVQLQASFGRTSFESDDGYGGVRTERSDKDFLVTAEDLILGGQQTEPQRGDRIKQTVGDQVLVYEVMPFGREKHFRYCDPYRKMLRIHTKHVDTESP